MNEQKFQKELSRIIDEFYKEKRSKRIKKGLRRRSSKNKSHRK
jgi:hypothetical protein